ncbi:hypothetical protein ACIA8G_35295 [Lentzea sp. NPDC051213]|uniref:hypothetical protein n=1 Tax=Lentzea sp. NPDC051213 TaxID=3364126 RepID=UPI0037A0E1E8
MTTEPGVPHADIPFLTGGVDGAARGRYSAIRKPRLLAIVVNLNDRLREAHDCGWLGEVDGLKVSLDAANQKLTQMRKVRAQNPLIQLSPTRAFTRPDRNASAQPS